MICFFWNISEEECKMVTKQYIDPELQYQVEQIIAGNMIFTNKYYREIIKALWQEFKLYCKEDTKIIKDRDKIIEMLQKW